MIEAVVWRLEKRRKLVKVFAIVFATTFSYSALLWFFSRKIREKPQYLVVFRLELLTGFEPVTSSLPRRRGKNLPRKNKMPYIVKVFATNHNIW